MRRVATLVVAITLRKNVIGKCRPSANGTEFLEFAKTLARGPAYVTRQDSDRGGIGAATHRLPRQPKFASSRHSATWPRWRGSETTGSPGSGWPYRGAEEARHGIAPASAGSMKGVTMTASVEATHRGLDGTRFVFRGPPI